MAVLLRLRLIGTSDLHANIGNYDYFRDRPDDAVGLAKTASLIAAARAESQNCLLFDNGDFLQGTPLGDWAAQEMKASRLAVHPVIAAMNALEYDASSLGNHEFNYGLEVLDAALSGARFPVLSCNIFRPDGTPRFTPSVILDHVFRDEDGVERKLRVGVIGFTTPQIVRWDEAALKGRATTAGIAETAAQAIPALRRAGADIVVALCHAGISRLPPSPDEENAAAALARIGGIDAMIVGHQHLLLPGEDFRGAPDVDVDRGAIAGVPTFMPGFWGSHLGVIDLTLSEDGERWRVTQSKVEVRPIYVREGDAIVAKVAAATEILALSSAAHEATLAYIRAPVGELQYPIHSYFALVAADASVEIVNAAQLWYAREISAPTPALQGLPLLSAASPFKCGGRGGPDYYTRVEAGAVAIKNVADLYVYPNALRILKVNGATLREWLERSASLYFRIDPKLSSAQMLLDKTAVSYDFDVIEGVAYNIDVTEPARYDDQGAIIASQAHRIVDLKFQGAPIDESADFLVVTNSYRAGAGGHFPGCVSANVVFEAPDANRDALMRYIAATGHVDPRPHATWRLKPWPAQVTALFPSSPAAAGEPSPAGLKITPAGPGEEGFALYRVEFVAQA